MWSRNETKIDQVLNSMTINLNIFGALMKCWDVRNEDGSLVVIEHGHGTQNWKAKFHKK